MTDRLFTATDLSSWLQATVPEDTAVMVERVVWGWLSPVYGNATDRPDEVSPALFAAALELGAIAHENPSGLTAYQLGEERSQYGSERRRAIIAEVAASVPTPGGAEGIPRGRFPRAVPYPDPVVGRPARVVEL